MIFLKRIFLLSALLPGMAFAQAYPSKPVRLIVGFPAGGPADIFGRALAAGMAVELGQPVVVENISGVGGVIGVDRVAKSAPDGYTLCINSASPLVIAPYSLAKMPYDVKKPMLKTARDFPDSTTRRKLSENALESEKTIPPSSNKIKKSDGSRNFSRISASFFNLTA